MRRIIVSGGEGAVLSLVVLVVLFGGLKPSVPVYGNGLKDLGNLSFPVLASYVIVFGGVGVSIWLDIDRYVGKFLDAFERFGRRHLFWYTVCVVFMTLTIVPVLAVGLLFLFNKVIGGAGFAGLSGRGSGRRKGS